MNYEKDLEIDEHHLDKEWLQQPTLFMRYAKEAAEVDRQRKKVKEQLEVTTAEIDTWVREQAKENSEKVTEKIVEGRVKTDPAYLEASKKLIDAEFDAAIMSYTVRAMDQKKTALENMVKLQNSGYFSAPKEEQNDDDEFAIDSAIDGVQIGPSGDRVTRLANRQKENLNKGRGNHDSS